MEVADQDDLDLKHHRRESLKIRSNRMNLGDTRWKGAYWMRLRAGHVARMGEINTYKIFIRKPERKRPR
jgi:hypothetical protein